MSWLVLIYHVGLRNFTIQKSPENPSHGSNLNRRQCVACNGNRRALTLHFRLQGPLGAKLGAVPGRWWIYATESRTVRRRR